MPNLFKYEDIGKEVKELFYKNYNLGKIKVNAVAKLNAADVRFEKESDLSTREIKGFLTAKHVFSPANLEMVHKFSSDNIICSEISLVDKIKDGTKLSLIPIYDFNTRKISGTLAGQYNTDMFTCRLEAAEIEKGRPILKNILVGAYEGWMAGVKMGYDTSSNKIDHKCGILGYYGNSFSVFTTLSEKGEVFGAIYQKMFDSKGEFGFVAQLPVNGNNTTKVEFATAYNYDQFHRVQGKANSQSQMELSFALKTGNGFTVSMSGLVDCKDIRNGAHKIGFGIDLNI